MLSFAEESNHASLTGEQEDCQTVLAFELPLEVGTNRNGDHSVPHLIAAYDVSWAITLMYAVFIVGGELFRGPGPRRSRLNEGDGEGFRLRVRTDGQSTYFRSASEHTRRKGFASFRADAARGSASRSFRSWSARY